MKWACACFGEVLDLMLLLLLLGESCKHSVGRLIHSSRDLVLCYFKSRSDSGNALFFSHNDVLLRKHACIASRIPNPRSWMFILEHKHPFQNPPQCVHPKVAT